MGTKDSWGFEQGDEITPDLVTVKLLGGGSSYEAYLAFDEVTYGPVVVKVVRPDQVDDESSLRGLRREVRRALDRQPPGRGPRSAPRPRRVDDRTWCWSRSTGRACRP